MLPTQAFHCQLGFHYKEKELSLFPSILSLIPLWEQEMEGSDQLSALDRKLLF